MAQLGANPVGVGGGGISLMLEELPLAPTRVFLRKKSVGLGDLSPGDLKPLGPGT
jgi:hypothetical protein